MISDYQKALLQGSPSRDLFKRKHKALNKNLYALDLDFVLVEKEPVAGIVAVLDYKCGHDCVSFSETIAYCDLIRRGIAVYIVSGNSEAEPPFIIDEFIGGHHEKPSVRTTPVQHADTWDDFERWEMAVRRAWRKRFERGDA